jgi:carboxyl-terminal processing protease
MPQFDRSADEIRTLMNRIRRRRSLIIDLRGDHGGAVETLETLIGRFVEPRTKIGDVKSRDPMQPIVARKTGDLYEGTLVVLVDSESASAAELFARMMQIEGRAKVIGDRTAGAVMMSRGCEHRIGGITFASSITIADILMPDGKSLENAGVVPDEILLPTAEDLAAGRDPAMSRAISLCGATVDPETAGGYFPFEWKQ